MPRFRRFSQYIPNLLVSIQGKLIIIHVRLYYRVMELSLSFQDHIINVLLKSGKREPDGLAR